MKQIYEVKTRDGICQYFDNKVEADFAIKDANEIGIGAKLQQIEVPTTSAEFASFLNRYWSRYRKLELTVRELAE